MQKKNKVKYERSHAYVDKKFTGKDYFLAKKFAGKDYFDKKKFAGKEKIMYI